MKWIRDFVARIGLGHTDTQPHRFGRLVEVENTERKTKRANPTYIWVRVQDETGLEYTLALTENDLKRLCLRADSNQEDNPFSESCDCTACE